MRFFFVGYIYSPKQSFSAKLSVADAETKSPESTNKNMISVDCRLAIDRLSRFLKTKDSPCLV